MAHVKDSLEAHFPEIPTKVSLEFKRNFRIFSMEVKCMEVQVN